MEARACSLLDRAGVESTLAARFERAVDRFGARPALLLDDGSWSYDALEARANGVAAGILRAEGDSGGPLPLLFEHGPWQIAALLGALKAGRACVALDPAAPAEWNRALLDRLGTPALWTSDALLAQARLLAPRAHAVDHLAPAERPRPRGDPGSPASIVFTSGSTGRAKGVVRSQRCILHRIWLYTAARRILPADRQSHLFSCSFVAAEADVWGALLNGAALVPARLARLDMLDFADWIRRTGVSLLHPPVSWFRRALRLWEERGLACEAPALRLIALAGEPLYGADAARVRQLFPAGVALAHRFSATETSNVASWTVEGDWPAEQRLPVGRGVADKRLRLVDADGQPVELGAVGALEVESAFLADGYWHDTEESRRRFYDGPRGPGFRTGDLLRARPDGMLEHCGRADAQLKVRGHRLEPSAIEGAMLALDGVREAALLAVPQGAGHELVACVAPESAAPGLRVRLAGKLPARMLPGRVRGHAALPLTATGKIDRQALIADLIAERGEATGKIDQARVGGRGKATGKFARQVVGELVGEREEATGKFARQAPVGDLVAEGGEATGKIAHAPVGDLVPGNGTARTSAAAPPAAPLDALVRASFAAVLGAPVEDDARSFWELGGDSIQAAEVCARLGRALGREVLPESMLHAPSVAGLAALLRAELPPSPLLELAPGRGRPLCCVDKPEVFRELLEHLPGQRVLGLGSAAVPDLPEMAARQLSALLQAQPDGPYALLGFSYGGLVAFELARQLLASGRRVGFLGLVDTLGPGLGDTRAIRTPEWVQVAWHTALRLPVQLGRLLRLPRERRAAFFRARLLDWRVSLGRARGAPPDPETEARRERARTRYVARPLDLPLTLYRAALQPPALWRARTLGWEDFAAAVEVVDVPSVHGIAMLQEPLCGWIAGHLRRKLAGLEGHR